MAGGGQAAFAAAVLKGIGAPVTSQNIAGFIGWSKAEGGDNWQRNNPLNTTMGGPGATGTINSAGVKAYANPQAGVRATVQTLRNGRYGGIINAFKSNNVRGLASAIGSSPWGTSGSLAAQTIAQTLGQHFSVPGGASSLGAAASANSLPATPGGSTVKTTQNVFNAAGFQQASQRAIAGQYLAGQSAASDPYAAGQPKTGLSTAASSNPLLSSGELTTSSPNPQSFVKAQTTLQHLAGSNAPLNQHPTAFQGNLKGSGYTNPLPGATWERTDMGVDASLPNGAPIRALGDSKVVAIRPNWYAGQPYVQFQLLNGPQAGKYYYIAEAINPSVRPGQTVRAGQVVGRFNSGGTGLELGWGTKGSQTLAQATGNTGGAGHADSPAGRSFRNFLNSIGAHAG